MSLIPRRVIRVGYGITVGASKETTALNAGPALAVTASAPADSENVGGTASGRAHAAAESSGGPDVVQIVSFNRRDPNLSTALR
jgi:hypothetical protein